MRPMVGLPSLSVLGHQHEGRKKNCFHRNDQRQERERVRVNWDNTMNHSHVHNYPTDKTYNMGDDKRDASCKPGDGFTKAITSRTLAHICLLDLHDRVNVALGDTGYYRRGLVYFAFHCLTYCVMITATARPLKSWRRTR